MAVFPRGNDALTINPPIGDQTLSVNGSDWLWAVTAVFCLSLVLVLAWTYAARAGEKIFHYLFVIALFSGTIAYFSMASDLGYVVVPVANNVDDNPGLRQIFYAKYINWFVSWTALTIAVSLLSGVSWATILYHVGLVWVWVVAWLASALTFTNYKWGFFAFGLAGLVVLSASLLHDGRLSATRVGIHRHYLPLTGWLVFLWLVYPIAFGLSDGGNKISVTSGFIFFGILDLLTVPLLAWAFLLLSRSWDYDVLGLQFTQYGRVAPGGVAPGHEKVPAATTPATA